MALLQTLLLSLHVSLLLLCWSALAELDVTMPDRVEVYQGDSAEILCQYRFYETEEPSNMMFFLYAQTHPGSSSRTTIYYGENEQQEVSNKTEYTDRLVVTNNAEEKNVLFTINNVNITDEREFTCSINGLDAGNSEAKTQLRVFVPPEAPVIEGVTDGISVGNRLPSTIATCEARNGFPPPNITWYRNRELLTPKEGHVNVFSLFYQSSVGLYTAQSTLQYKVVKEDEDAEFSCEVTFFVPKATKKSESNSVNVTVHYPTTMAELWKELPQGLVKEGDTVELRCQGDGNPPPSFIINRLEGPSWFLDNSNDVLILPSVSRQDSGTYQCRPQNTNDETVKGEMLLAVHYLDPAVVVPKDSEVMLRGEELVATCNALSSLKTITVWYKNGIQVGEGNTLHLNDATYETSGEYVCEVTVLSLPSLHTSASVHIIVQGGPELVGAEQDVQMVETGKMANLTCEAMGHPLPNIYWTVTGSENWHEVMNNASDHMTRSTVSVKVTSNIGAVCNATNDMGSEAKSFSIKSIPRVTSAASFSPAEGSGVIIVVIILSLLLLAILGSVLYFLHKKGKLPTGRYGKQEITKTSKDDIVIEMKNNGKNEESVHLKSHNGNTKGHNEQ